MIPPNVPGPTGDIHYVLDGGALLQSLSWKHGSTYGDICTQYTNYVSRKYGNPTVIFDGYTDEPSTKDGTHQRRAGGHVGATVDIASNMLIKSKKEEFLSNKENKQRFVNLLGTRLEEIGCAVKHAKGDADVLIATTVVETAASHQTVLVGEDKDLIVLLCHYAHDDAFDTYFVPEAKMGAKKCPRCWNIKVTKGVLGKDIM